MNALEKSVSARLQSKGLPQGYLAPVIEAIDWVKQGEFEVIVYLPLNISPRPANAKLHQDQLYITASDLVDSLQLIDYIYGEAK